MFYRNDNDYHEYRCKIKDRNNKFQEKFSFGFSGSMVLIGWNLKDWLPADCFIPNERCCCKICKGPLSWNFPKQFIERQIQVVEM